MLSVIIFNQLFPFVDDILYSGSMSLQGTSKYMYNVPNNDRYILTWGIDFKDSA